MQDKNFLIVGLGMMGGGYAMGLHKKGYAVAGLDCDNAAVSYALERGFLDEGATEEGAERLLAKADYVVLALYPQQMIPWLQAHRGFLKRDALLSDLAGVKGVFLQEAQELLAPWHELISCHPMAGREAFGVQNADDGIFVGANFLITPTQRNSATGLHFAHWLAETLDFGHVLEISPAHHDQLIGYVSQLTHAIAVSLMNTNSDPLLPEVTGDSFRDLTRIANINAPLWSELFLDNAAVLTQQIDDFTDTLKELRQRLAIGDKAGLEELFRQSTERRRSFGPQSGSKPK